MVLCPCGRPLLHHQSSSSSSLVVDVAACVSLYVSVVLVVACAAVVCLHAFVGLAVVVVGWHVSLVQVAVFVKELAAHVHDVCVAVVVVRSHVFVTEVGAVAPVVVVACLAV